MPFYNKLSDRITKKAQLTASIPLYSSAYKNDNKKTPLRVQKAYKIEITLD